MNCPCCGAEWSGQKTVVNTSPDDLTNVRRRVCPSCKEVTFTMELPIPRHHIYSTSGRGKYFVQDRFLKHLLKASYD